jgi:RNA polymerase sigma factor (sigma-70 family)
MESEGSITRVFKELTDGGDRSAADAFGVIYERNFKWLIAVARRSLEGAPRGAVDEEDVVQSGLMAFFSAARNGQFPELENRKNLRRLLLTIIERKAINQRNHQLAKKRGGGRARRGDSVFANTGDSSDQAPGVQPQSTVPTPVMIAEVRESVYNLLKILNDDSLRRIAVMKLERFTSAEIADAIGVVERTVERKLSLIRKRWADELGK